MFSDAKTVSFPVENIVTAHHPSPAVSSISSYGSGNFLVHGQGPKTGHKRKTVSLSFGKKRSAVRLTNVVWSGLFLLVIVATIVVVVALAENIRRNLFSRVSFKDDNAFQPISSMLDEAVSKVQPDDGKSCFYQRTLWERGSKNTEIIHDLSAKWSAVVDHEEQHCLLFNLPNSRIAGCSYSYPWDLDVQVGVPGCRGVMAKLAPIRKIMHHMSSVPVNLSVTGEYISSACADFALFHVDKVSIEYYDRNLKRVARSTVGKVVRSAKTLQLTPEIIAAIDKLEHHGKVNEIANKTPELVHDLFPSLDISNPRINKTVETSTRISEKSNVVIASEEKAKILAILNTTPENIVKNSPTPPEIMPKSQRIDGKFEKQTLTSALFVNIARSRVGGKPVLKASNPMGALKKMVAWEGVYDPAGSSENKVVRAQSLKELLNAKEWVIDEPRL